MNNEILITNKDCDKLLRAHDGDCALLFLWHAATGSSDLEQAAGDLCMTPASLSHPLSLLLPCPLLRFPLRQPPLRQLLPLLPLLLKDSKRKNCLLLPMSSRSIRQKR